MVVGACLAGLASVPPLRPFQTKMPYPPPKPHASLPVSLARPSHLWQRFIISEYVGRVVA
eukprot:CAMPEP_0206527542 /NCGR_PEP_ID=MMETSP0325_2-20121206/1407_1 /ASSEMBLY_ACC=CAM_ASM_000347 /TAXON_ID=2866 /ORGANISM="Crypthecodinium cohnii, Strain Seligo" /LENGTH=59 /DNA_ID=CAMNT_0054022965 /DNA_START=35 /DNA_END=211 /DNA_ORIENTATION=-